MKAVLQVKGCIGFWHEKTPVQYLIERIFSKKYIFIILLA